MLSTYRNTDIQTVQRKSRRGETTDVPKPTVTIDYTAYMGAVDRADHLCTSYQFARKSVKWWQKLFFWTVEVSIVNSYILFNEERKQLGTEEISHLKYRKQLMRQLVGDVHNPSKRRGRLSTHDTSERMGRRQHFVGQNDRKNKDSAACSCRKLAGGHKTTTFYCKTCSRHQDSTPYCV